VSHDLELRTAWQAHVCGDTELLDRLLARYRERHRRYHGVAHVAWVVRHIDELAFDEQVSDHGAVVAAAFYHDAVYEPAHRANERASARLARRDLTVVGTETTPSTEQSTEPSGAPSAGNWPAPRIEAVAAMIEATADHRDPPDIDTSVLFDADLAVLGADVAGYDAYVTGVRAEYRHVDEPDWQTGRATVLRGFLARPAIYATDAGRERWEVRARANLTAELATLT
jgi:predicted metal-dependent HD superfamily phosphohydrolase